MPIGELGGPDSEMFFDFDIKEFENIKPDIKKYQPSLWNTELEWIEYYNESD